MWSENSIMIEALVYNALYLCGYLIPHSTLHTPHLHHAKVHLFSQRVKNTARFSVQKGNNNHKNV